MHQISLCIWYTFIDSIIVYLCSLNCIYSSQLLIYSVRCILLTAGVCHGFEVMTETPNTTFSCVTSSFQECLKWIIYHNTCHPFNIRSTLTLIRLQLSLCEWPSTSVQSQALQQRAQHRFVHQPSGLQLTGRWTASLLDVEAVIHVFVHEFHYVSDILSLVP